MKKKKDGGGGGGIAELGLMCRSGFGIQEGEFELFVGKIEAVERSRGMGSGMMRLFRWGVTVVIARVNMLWRWMTGRDRKSVV